MNPKTKKMMLARTTPRAFRMPTVLDRAIGAQAKLSNTNRTAVLVSVVLRALRNGELPKPATQIDARQLDFLESLNVPSSTVRSQEVAA